MTAKWLLAVAIGLLAGDVRPDERRPPDTEKEKEKVSYAMGVAVANNIQRHAVEVDVEVLARGVRDALAGRKLLMSEEELRSTMSGVTAALKRKQREAAAKRSSDRKAAGEAFRVENASKPGVVTLPSGIQYQVLEVGKGKTPTDADTVTWHYRSTSIDGRVVESSYRRGKPVTVTMARAPPGWKEVLKLMPVGSRWKVVVPPEVGWVARGRERKSKVGRKETLVFEIEVLGIDPGAPADPSKTTASAQPAAR
jgi:FKBP-type peptidyl-prolyl cis-trans isomerase